MRKSICSYRTRCPRGLLLLGLEGREALLVLCCTGMALVRKTVHVRMYDGCNVGQALSAGVFTRVLCGPSCADAMQRVCALAFSDVCQKQAAAAGTKRALAAQELAAVPGVRQAGGSGAPPVFSSEFSSGAFASGQGRLLDNPARWSRWAPAWRALAARLRRVPWGDYVNLPTTCAFFGLATGCVFFFFVNTVEITYLLDHRVMVSLQGVPGYTKSQIYVMADSRCGPVDVSG